MLINRLCFFGVLPLMIFPGVVVHAQTPLAECAAIQNAETRLACYDSAMEQSGASDLPVVRLPRASSPPGPPNQSDTSSTSEQDDAPAMTDNFGLENKQSGDGIEQKTFVVAEASHNDFTGWTIEFRNGQVWQQIGTEDYRIKVGDSYIIQRAMMNSFMLGNSENNRKIRIQRIR